MNNRILLGLVTLGFAGQVMAFDIPFFKAEEGSAVGGQTVKKDDSALQRCDRPMGTVAIQEDTGEDWYYTLTHDKKLSSTVPVIRLLVQKTGCFVVVERGKAMKNMAMERQLRDSGELRKTSKMGKGQIVAADYTLSPSITFSEKGTSGVGAFVGSIVSSITGSTVGSAAGSAMANVSTNDASVVLNLVDNRSGVQLIAAEGNSKSFDFSGTVLFGGDTGGLNGYSKTPEGKALVGAFVDAMNNVVQMSKEYKAQNIKGGMGTGGGLKVQQD